MATITFKGNPVATYGDLPAKETNAPDFTLVKTDLGNFSLADAAGRKVILNIFPSLDTSVCAASVRKFNELAAQIPDTLVLAISKDLPFAHNRFCTTEGIKNVVPLSGFRDNQFGKAYGVEMTGGPLAGLYSRCIVIIDENGKVKYTQQVPEITMEPDYDAALAAL